MRPSGRSLGWLFIVGLVAFFLSLRYGGQSGRLPDSQVFELVALVFPERCSPAESPCVGRHSDLQAAVQFQAQPSALKPFLAELRLTGVAAGVQVQQVRVAYDMVGMDMPPAVFTLAPGEDAWRVESVLPLCTLGRRDWVMQVRLTAGQRRYEGQFAFASQ